jgi:LPXTG-site transpeptidase (sortase) family protein
MLSSKHPRAGRIAQLLIASLMLLTLALSVIPAGAETAGREYACPEGQVLIDGECVDQPYFPPIDIAGHDNDRIDIDIDPGDLIQTPEPTETPVIDIDQPIDLPSPTPTFELPPDIDLTPAAEDTTGYVTVHKYDCGGDQEAYQWSLDELRAACAPSAGVEFTAFNSVNGGQQELAAQSSADTDGLAFLQMLNPETVTVVETLPPAYGQPIASCGLVIGAGPALGPLQVLSDATVTLTFEGNQEYYCDWFNVALPTEETGDIDVQKYVCPADFDAYQADFATLQSNCTDPLPGIEFRVQDGNQVVRQDDTDANGFVSFADVPAGSYSLVEAKPYEYGPARAFCQTLSADLPVQDWTEYPTSEGIGIEFDLEFGQLLDCAWFNIPVEDDGVIEIDKYACEYDPGDGIFADPAFLEENCQPLDDIEFSIEGGSGSGTKISGELGPGKLAWENLAPDVYTVQETVPDGYGEPAVYCQVWYDGSLDGSFVPPVNDASIMFELGTKERTSCVWINLPLEDGSITIYKHLCPPGYDIYAYGADPWIDCTGKANGVGFWLNGTDYQQTGDPLDSAVAWDGLAPGYYLVAEDVPPDTKTVFVLKCEGNSAPMIQNYPVSIGSEFQLYVESGDHIVCHWYNVPKAEHSTITVVKYACSTETFVSQDYCQLYEGGAGFELSVYGNNGWSYLNSGYTNAGGVLVFGGLQNGIYQIDEIDGAWCYATADYTDAQGYLIVDNQDVTVWVYNCGIELPKPKPIEYPNTGVGQSAVQPTIATAPVIPSDAAAVLDWRQWTGVLDSRLIAPFAASGKPAKIEIESIGVSAAVETLEIVEGAFQEPTSAEQVAWYKDTSWLGDEGNIVLAGHLNYWGVPEGVFFALDTVAPGSIVEITAENGTVYRYEVTTVELLPADAASLESVTAETGGETLTLITCGGDWDPTSQHYLHRTVVQATRIA